MNLPFFFLEYNSFYTSIDFLKGVVSSQLMGPYCYGNFSLLIHSTKPLIECLSRDDNSDVSFFPLVPLLETIQSTRPLRPGYQTTRRRFHFSACLINFPLAFWVVGEFSNNPQISNMSRV